MSTTADRFKQVVLLGGSLDYVCVGSGLDAALAVFVGTESGHEHERHVLQARVRPHLLGELEPGHVRHLDVREDQVAASLLEEVPCLKSV